MPVLAGIHADVAINTFAQITNQNFAHYKPR
jgi:hypothetical protein